MDKAKIKLNIDAKSNESEIDGSVADEIEKMYRLMKKGAITKKEFETHKKQLLKPYSLEDAEKQRETMEILCGLKPNKSFFEKWRDKRRDKKV